MEREYRNPEAAARATQERVEEALVREVRRGVRERPFVLRTRFEYEGGRRGPLLYIGTLSRAWVDYINGNARATDLVHGVCTSGRRTGGGSVLHLEVRGGRGATEGNLREMNRAMRWLNIELAYATGGAGEEAPGTAPQQPGAGSAVPDLLAEAREIRERFETFRAAPSAAGLAELRSRVGAWGEALAGAPEHRGSKAAEVVERIAAFLEARGDDLVGGPDG